MDRVVIAVAAFVGALLAGLLAWLESGEPWDWRKYGATAIRAVFSGLLFAIQHPPYGNMVLAVLYAILGGAGVQVIANHISGKLAWGYWPVPKKGSRNHIGKGGGGNAEATA